MKLSAIALISLVLPALTTSLLALDPAMLSLVSPTATSVAGVDMVRVQASPFGRYMMGQLNRQASDLDKFASATGFDPRRDLQEVLVATTGSAAAQQGLIIARGSFDQQRLLNMAKTAGLLSTGYKGTTVITPQQNSGIDAVAFLAGYLVAGSRADVEGAIDRSTGKGSSSGLASRAMLASTRYDAWLVTNLASDLAENLPGGNAGINLRGINSLAGGVQFGTLVDIGVEAEARSAQDATSLADVLRFAVALGQSNKAATELNNALASLTITTEGSLVKAGVKVPQADLEKLFNGQQARPARTRRVAAR